MSLDASTNHATMNHQQVIKLLGAITKEAQHQRALAFSEEPEGHLLLRAVVTGYTEHLEIQEGPDIDVNELAWKIREGIFEQVEAQMQRLFTGQLHEWVTLKQAWGSGEHSRAIPHGDTSWYVTPEEPSYGISDVIADGMVQVMNEGDNEEMAELLMAVKEETDDDSPHYLALVDYVEDWFRSGSLGDGLERDYAEGAVHEFLRGRFVDYEVPVPKTSRLREQLRVMKANEVHYQDFFREPTSEFLVQVTLERSGPNEADSDDVDEWEMWLEAAEAVIEEASNAS